MPVLRAMKRRAKNDLSRNVRWPGKIQTGSVVGQHPDWRGDPLLLALSLGFSRVEADILWLSINETLHATPLTRRISSDASIIPSFT
jgi:hypothetical protein